MAQPARVYRDTAPGKYRKTWLERMARGASTLCKLFDKCGTHLTQTMKSDQGTRSVQDLIIILFDLVGEQGKAHTNEVRQSAPFRTNLFIYMRRNAERKIAPSDTNAERCAIRNTIGFTPRPFIELCLKADLFAALDPMIPRVASMQGVATQLIRKFFCVENVTMAAPSLLQHQLPWRTRCSCSRSWTRVPRGLNEFDRTGALRRGMPLTDSQRTSTCYFKFLSGET
ncbi:hypothetical protein FOMPIDRAFT_1054229 [Fomitopsis schrenkii]|uniref:Uncharacterized protein n=1 Tax=Fomitopsis schrenkii TaxID=2126942 RepID=S8DPT6_FOMSC|nr:hypothetical protein FOMPIDRAFT_1054229 [Fomitopsis schrenkii]